MDSDQATLIDDVIGQIRLNRPGLARGWFAGLEVASLDRGTCFIQARNAAQVRYLEQHCQTAFTEAVQAATGRLVGVRFVADTNGEAEVEPGFGLPDELALNPDYRFEHFVTGPCNRLAHAAAQAVAEDPGRAYNPLFVHGPVGLGKTHLLQATCHRMMDRRPGTRVGYLSCETFINHFMEAVESGGLHQFRYRYRHVDALVIDDIQFLAERERSQEEFFHTFNTLHQTRRQIILSADCTPSEIPSLEERLISRFNSGLVALLDRPCLETRMAIVSKKAKLRCIEVPEEVVRLIATRVDSNIRELEGTLVGIDAQSQMNGGVITLELARKALGVGEEARSVEVGTILEAVAERYRVKISAIRGKKRFKDVILPRHVSMYLARELTNESLEQIGGHFGGRDHTTVLHAVRSVDRQLATDAELRTQVDQIREEIRFRSL